MNKQPIEQAQDRDLRLVGGSIPPRAWEAEPAHQHYLQRYPNGYTCHFIRPEWKLPKRLGSD
jgi:peptide methionine sulfoxide reductase MsrA